MATPDWWETLEACPVADEADWLRHAEGFVAAFVAPAKRDRWRWLLTARPRRVGRDSHKLHSDLDRRRCRPVRLLPEEVCRVDNGLFYAFANAPRVVPTASVARAAGAGDAIFSIVPGEMALYFFHEGEVWVCQSDG